jgi:hypothetical protein
MNEFLNPKSMATPGAAGAMKYITKNQDLNKVIKTAPPEPSNGFFKRW